MRSKEKFCCHSPHNSSTEKMTKWNDLVESVYERHVLYNRSAVSDPFTNHTDTPLVCNCSRFTVVKPKVINGSDSSSAPELSYRATIPYGLEVGGLVGFALILKRLAYIFYHKRCTDTPPILNLNP